MCCSTTPERRSFLRVLAGQYGVAFWLGAFLTMAFAGLPAARQGSWLARELVLARLAPLLGPPTLRLLGGTTGEIAILATLAAWISLPGGAILALWATRRRQISLLGAHMVIGTGALLLVHGTLWLSSASLLAWGGAAFRPLPLALLLLAGTLGSLALALPLGRLLRSLPRQVGDTLAAPAILLALATPLMLVAAGKIAGARAPLAHSPSEPPPPTVPVVLIGIDGLGRQCLRTIEEAGAAPTLAAMFRKNEGFAAPLVSIHPALSPPVWTSIATGKRPWQHGIDGFVFEGERAVPAHAGHRTARPLWEIAGDAGLRCLIVNWYVTWPATTPQGSLLVSDRFLLDTLNDRIAPATRSAEVDSIVAAHRPRADSLLVTIAGDEPDPSTHPVAHSAWLHLGREIERDWLASRILLHYLAESSDWDLVALYLRGTDGAQHRFWREHVAAHGPASSRWAFRLLGSDTSGSPFGDVVLDYYRQVDRWLAEIVALADPGSRFLVVSDHGAGVRLGNLGRADLDPLFERLDLLSRDARGEVDRTRSRLWDATPLRTRTPRVRRVALGGAFSPEDAAELLRSLETTEGATIVSSIELENGQLRVELDRGLPGGSSVALPDGSGLPVKSFAAVSIEGDFTGAHRMDGVLVASFGGPSRRLGAGRSVLDLAPTLLQLLGLPAGADMEGSAIDRLLSESPMARIESWERPGSPLLVPSHDSDEEIRRDLRSLGYIE